MSHPVLKVETIWGQPSGVANVREEIIAALKSSSGIGPGYFLRQLRETAKLELREAATQLSMSTVMVQALEEDDFERLPAPIYTKGFYRRYCDLLAIAPEPVINAYEHVASLEIPGLNRIKAKTDLSGPYISFRHIAYAIAILFIMLIVYWGQSIDFNAMSGMVSNEVGSADDTPTELSLPAFGDNSSLSKGSIDKQ